MYAEENIFDWITW